jgi:hypothetical protein
MRIAGVNSMEHAERTGADARRDYIAAIAAAGTRIAELAAEVEMEVAALSIPPDSWEWTGDLCDTALALEFRIVELQALVNIVHARRSVRR